MKTENLNISIQKNEGQRDSKESKALALHAAEPSLILCTAYGPWILSGVSLKYYWPCPNTLPNKRKQRLVAKPWDTS